MTGSGQSFAAIWPWRGGGRMLNYAAFKERRVVVQRLPPAWLGFWQRLPAVASPGDGADPPELAEDPPVACCGPPGLETSIVPWRCRKRGLAPLLFGIRSPVGERGG